MTQTQDLDHLWRFSLRRGNSETPTEGACLLDAVSWFEFGHLGDHPPCTCPVQAAYGRILNDFLDDDRRQVLRSYIIRLVGTVDPPSEILRAEYAVKHTIREVLPIALDACGFYDHARHCAELSFDVTMEECRTVANAATDAITATIATATRIAAATAAEYRTAAAGRAADAAATAAAWLTTAARSDTNHTAATTSATNIAATAAEYAARSTAHPDRIYDMTLSIFDGMIRIGRQADSIPSIRVKTVNDSFADCALSHQR